MNVPKSIHFAQIRPRDPYDFNAFDMEKEKKKKKQITECRTNRSGNVCERHARYYERNSFLFSVFKMSGRGHISSISVVPDLTNGERRDRTVVSDPANGETELFISSEAVLIV